MVPIKKKQQKNIKKLESKLLPGFLGTVIEKDAVTGVMEAYSPGVYGVKTPLSDDVFGFCGKYPWKFAVTLTGESKEGVRDTVEFDTLDPVTFEELNWLIIKHGRELIEGLGEDLAMKARIIVVGMGR